MSCKLLVSLRGGGEFQTVTHDALTILAIIEVLPEFLSDKRHEGMQHLQQDLEELEGLVISCLVDRLCLTVDVGGLHHLQIPA